MKTFKEMVVNEASVEVILKQLRNKANSIESISKTLKPTAMNPKQVINLLGSGYKKDFDEITTILDDATMAIEEIIMDLEKN